MHMEMVTGYTIGLELGSIFSFSVSNKYTFMPSSISISPTHIPIHPFKCLKLCEIPIVIHRLHPHIFSRIQISSLFIHKITLERYTRNIRTLHDCYDIGGIYLQHFCD